MPIQLRYDSRRGCGTRKPGGIYLVSDGPGFACGRLPAALDVCPTCSCGIKPARGWTWIDAGEFLSKRNCTSPAARCQACPTIVGRHGLLWIGEAFYPTPAAWLEEAGRIGVSRRIKSVPKDFVLGQTWVLVAHRRAIPAPPCGNAIDGALTGCARREGHDGDCSLEREWIAGIFHAFQPQAIEYVVTGKETDEEIAALEKRGLTPVRVFVDGRPLDELADDAGDDTEEAA